jgi:hypothetical protein
MSASGKFSLSLKMETGQNRDCIALALRRKTDPKPKTIWESIEDGL